jgi:hypothetical protein
MDNSSGLLIAALVGFGLWSAVMGNRRCHAHVRAWARQHGYGVASIQYRFNPFSPFFLRSSRSQRVYDVVFVDAQGRHRPAIVRVGGFFTGSFTDDVRVVWR